MQSKDEDATYDFDDEELYKNGGILLEKLQIESLLEVGDEIEIIEGDMVGMFGRVIEILKNDTVRIGVKLEDGEIEVVKQWMNFALHFDQETPSQSRLVYSQEEQV